MYLAGNYCDSDNSFRGPPLILPRFATSTATIYAVNRSRQAPKLLIYIWWKIWVRLLPLPPFSKKVFRSDAHLMRCGGLETQTTRLST